MNDALLAVFADAYRALPDGWRFRHHALTVHFHVEGEEVVVMWIARAVSATGDAVAPGETARDALRAVVEMAKGARNSEAQT